MKLRPKKSMRRWLAAGLLAPALGFSAPTMVRAQDIADGLPDQIQDRLSPGNRRDTGVLNQPGDAAERGLREATRGVLEGRSPGESIQRGLNESLRSATETPEQTLRRDQWQYEDEQRYRDQLRYQEDQRYQDGQRFQEQGRYQDQMRPQDQARYNEQWRYQDQGRRQFSDPAPDTDFSGTSRPVYHRDEFGRPFFVDSIGQRFVYQDGRWMRAQGMSGQSRPFQQGQPMNRSGDIAGNWNDSAPQRLGVSINESPRGLRVNDVERQSPAEMAGLQRGDVILRANGQEVRSPQSFVQTVQNLDQGERLDLTVLRNGQEQSLTATMSGDDTRRMAKPAINGEMQESSQALRQRVRQLEQELDQLRQRVERRMTSEEGASEQGGIQSVLGQEQSQAGSPTTSDRPSTDQPGDTAAERTREDSRPDAATQDAAPTDDAGEGNGPLDDLLNRDTGLNTDAASGGSSRPSGQPSGSGGAGSGG